VSRRALAALLGCLAACAPNALPSESRRDPISERFVVEPWPATPPWKRTSDRHTRQGASSRWAPEGAAPDAPGDSLWKEIRFGAQQAEASDFARDELARLAKDCPGAKVGGPHAGTEDGNDVAYGEVSCSRPALVLVKVIRGHEAQYLAERTFQDPPGAQALRAANAFMSERVYLCPIYAATGRCATRVDEEN